jgi:YfiH family protein
MNQTHGDQVVIIDGTVGVEPDADAMITQVTGLSLAVLVADCIPLLLWDENSLNVAAVHVGRKGLMNGIAIKTVEMMRDLGSENVRGVLGPSICGKCYEVGADIFEDVTQSFPEAISRTRTGMLSLDLSKALQDQLTASAVLTVRARSCTAEEGGLFSYRRDGVTGRFAGLISL